MNVEVTLPVRKLHRILATLFPRPEEQRDIAKAASLDEAAIPFDASALNSWSEIVRHAERHGEAAVTRLARAASLEACR